MALKILTKKDKPDFVSFEKELEALINEYSIDNWVDEPDFVIAESIMAHLGIEFDI